MSKIHINIITEYIKKYSKLGDTDLARLILQENSEGQESNDVSVNRVRSRISIEKKRLGSKETEPKVVKKRYRWKTIYGSIDIPVDEIDELFYEYSKHGLNMSQTAIINKHGFEAWQWQSIKRKLQLLKDSNLFSPHTVSLYSGKELDEMINELISRKYKNKGQLVEKAYEKQTLKAYKKVIDENDKLILEKDIFYNEILAQLPKAKLNTIINKARKAKNKKKEHGVITLADLHLGARVEKLHNTPDFNPEVLEGYLDKMAEQINQEQYGSVTLAFLGDLIESFTGLNHKNSWKGIEYGYYGSTVVIKTVEMLTRFISKVNNVDRVLGVNGNHDRSTSDNKEDSSGEIGTIIFFMLKNILGKYIEVIHQEDVVSIEVDGIQYIITHGHLGESKKGAEKIINLYGNNKLFNIILTGHLHSRIISDDSSRFRHIWCPSLFTGNQYSKQLGFSSTAGYLRIESNGEGKPNVYDICL